MPDIFEPRRNSSMDTIYGVSNVGRNSKSFCVFLAESCAWKYIGIKLIGISDDTKMCNFVNKWNRPATVIASPIIKCFLGQSNKR